MRWFARQVDRKRKTGSVERRRALNLESLEDRRLLTVTAVQQGVRLTVSLDAPGDVAVLGGANSNVVVNGSGFQQVQAITIQGSNASSQQVQLLGAVSAMRGLEINRVSTVRIDGRYRVGDLTINLSDQAGGIHGAGSFVTLAEARFSAPKGDITLDGSNEFNQPVSINNAVNVSLTTHRALRLARMRIQGSATLTSADLLLTSRSDNYFSQSRAPLTLQPDSRFESIIVGGSGRGYTLRSDEIDDIQWGFGSLTIGRADGEHDILLSNVRFAHDTLIRTPMGGSITTRGQSISGLGQNMTFLAPNGVIDLTSNLTLSGKGTLKLDGSVVIGARNLDVYAGRGNIVFAGSIDDGEKASVLDLESPEGDITLGTIGNNTPLAGLRIVRAENVNFNGNARVGYVKQLRGLGTTTVNGSLTATDAGSAVDLTAAGLVFNRRVAAFGQTILLHATRNGLVDNWGMDANKIRLFGLGNFRLDASNEAFNVLAADVYGSLTVYNRRSLKIGNVEGTRGLNSRGRDIKIRVAGQLTIGDNTPGGNSGIVASRSNLALDADSIVQAGQAPILAGNLVIARASRVELASARNDVSTIVAQMTGDLNFSDVDNVTVGSAGGLNGIRTQGGNVRLRALRRLIVAAPIDTTPGTGGSLTSLGDKSRLQLDVQPTLGAGNVDLGTGLL